MKNIITKIITTYVVVAALILVLKVGDNILAKASTSNTGDQCGINNGWVWNGSQCVNTCDQNHPWDSNQQKCSNGYGYTGYVYTNNGSYGNCGIYGSNYYWNGSVCAQIVSNPNATYVGNPYNGGYTTPIYNYVPVNNGYTYSDYNYVSSYVSPNTYTYTNNNCNSCNTNYVPMVHTTNTCNSCYVNPAPKVVTTYYIYTYTTTSYPTNYYSNYSYLGNNNGYYNNYWDCDYSDYSNVGYYDIYGNYHF